MSVNGNAYFAQILTQLALVQGSISTVGNLQSATPVVLQTVYAAAQNLLAPFNAAIDAFDADIDITTFGGVSVGPPAPALTASLLAQALDVEQQGLLIVGRAYARRAAANIYNAPG